MGKKKKAGRKNMTDLMKMLKRRMKFPEDN